MTENVSPEVVEHAPGPWRASGMDVFDAEGGLVVSLTTSYKPNKKRDRADLSVIAAAPSLLAALIVSQAEACGDWCNASSGTHTPSCRAAREAITLATQGDR